MVHLKKIFAGQAVFPRVRRPVDALAREIYSLHKITSRYRDYSIAISCSRCDCVCGSYTLWS